MPLIPSEYKYIAIIVALLLAIGFIYHKGQTNERDHLQAAQARADQKERDHVAKVQADDQLVVDKLQDQLGRALIEPVIPGVSVRMCVNTAAPSSPVRSDSGPHPTGNGPGGPGGGMGSDHQGSTEGIDVAPATEAILKRDKAVIDYLQGYIRECQDKGVCAKTP